MPKEGFLCVFLSVILKDSVESDDFDDCAWTLYSFGFLIVSCKVNLQRISNC